MLDTGLFTIPLLSLLVVFGFAIITDVNMIAFDVKSVPQLARDMGFDANNVRDTIMYKIHAIANTAETSRGITYSTISDIHVQSLKNISETLGIEDSVLAVQGFLGLIPYRLKGKIMQEGDAFHLIITGFSSNNDSFILNLSSDTPVLNSVQIIKGQAGLMRGASDTRLLIANTNIEIQSLLQRAAEAIVDRIDPYLLARYYFVLETPTNDFKKTIPQLMRCIDILPKNQQVWPLLLWGRIYQFKGNYAKAIEIYQQISQLDPKFPFAPLRWGEVLAKSGKHDDAIFLYQKAIYNTRFYPNYPVARSTAYNLWANSLIALKKIDEAEKILRIGINAFYFGNERSSANALIHHALGKFLMNYKQDYLEAEYHLRQAVYMSGDPKYYASLQEIIEKIVPGYEKIPTATTPQSLTTKTLTNAENGDEPNQVIIPTLPEDNL